VPVPDVGYEIMGARDEVEGEAELAWSSARLALLLPESAHLRSPLDRQGWSCWVINEAGLDGEIAASIATTPGGHDR